MELWHSRLNMWTRRHSKQGRFQRIYWIKGVKMVVIIIRRPQYKIALGKSLILRGWLAMINIKNMRPPPLLINSHSNIYQEIVHKSCPIILIIVLKVSSLAGTNWGYCNRQRASVISLGMSGIPPTTHKGEDVVGIMSKFVEWEIKSPTTI